MTSILTWKEFHSIVSRKLMLPSMISLASRRILPAARGILPFAFS
jgi:hypothetical protein